MLFIMAKNFIVETSARHVHVSQKDLETLFGAGYELTVKKDLSQPGQFACAERVDLVGPKKTIPGVSILGPCRPSSQVEISLSDARTLGVEALVRESGDTAGTNGIKVAADVGCAFVCACEPFSCAAFFDSAKPILLA